MLFCHDLTRYVFILPGLRAAQFMNLELRHQELFLATLICPSFLTHSGFVMVSTQRMEEWNDENDRTEMGNSLVKMSMRKSVFVSRLVDRHCHELSADRKRPPTGTSATRFQQSWMARLGPHWVSRDEKSLDVGVQGAAVLGC